MANNTTQFNIKINGTDQIVQLNDLLGQTSDTLGDLKNQQQALSQAFEQADYGSVEFLKLRDALQDVNSQIKTVDESVEGLTITEKLQGAVQAVGAVGSAFAFASTSVQAFGDANSQTAQDLQRLETQIQAIQQGFTTFSELTSAITEKNGLFKRSIDFIGKGFTAAGISARGFGLVTRAALAATGVGLLVVGISALIANFDEIKAAGAEIFKSWQPFFDGVRNIASSLTFGLIDNATTAKIKGQAEDIAASIKKTQETTSAELDAINTKFELRQITAVQKAQQTTDLLNKQFAKINRENSKLLQDLAPNKDLDAFFNSINKLKGSFNIFGDKKLEQNIKGIVFNINELFKKRATNTLTPLDVTKAVTEIQNLSDGIKDVEVAFGSLNTLGPIKYRKELQTANKVKDEIVSRTKDLSVIEQNLNSEITARNDAQKAGITQKDVEIAQLKEEAQITKEIADLNAQINLEQEKRSKTNNDLLKQGIDLILSFGNALRSPEFTEDLPVFENFKDQLKFITTNLQGDFKKIFDDILTKSPKAIVDVTTLTEAVRKYTDEQVRLSKLEGEGRIDVLQAEIALNKELITVETNQKAKDVLLAKNRLLRQQIKAIEAEVQSTISNIELATTQLLQSIPRTFDAAKFEEQGRQLDKAKQAFEDYKNGLQLTVEQSNLLFNTFGINSKQAFDKLDEATRNAIENKFTSNLIFQLTKLKEQAKDLAVTFPEVKDAINQYTDAIDEATKALGNNDKASQERIKNLQEELNLLQKQSELTKNQVVAQRPAQTLKQFEEQKKAITRNGELQKEIIEDNFKAETKGLKETDIRYQIAIQKRDDALRESSTNTIKLLDDARQAFGKLILNSIGDIINSIGQVSDALYQAQTESIDRQITLNQYAIDTLSEQISGIQEQIGFIDEIINQRKATIDELQSAAESSTAGQREEILKQLDAEVKRTKDLVKEKKALQKQEENATKQQQKLEKENQKLAAQSIVIQQKQAVAAQILGLAQTAVAIATIAASSASKDFTFGIATVASIAAVAGALAINIIGINNALKNLNTAEANPILQDADGGFARDAKPLPKMAQGGYTPMKGMGRDTTGEDNVGTYRLHANEYVVPRWMVESAKYGSMVHEMERARKRGFAEGGSPIPLRQINVDANQEMSLLLRANLNKPVFVAVTDINDGQSRVNVIENRGRF